MYKFLKPLKLIPIYIWLVIPVYFIVACRSDNLQESEPLASLIIGEWEHVSQKGFPYNRDSFEVFEEALVIYNFANDGACVYTHLVLDFEQEGSYRVEEETDELNIFWPNDTLHFRVVESSTNEMVWEFDQVEGRGWQKYQRLK